ncbi:phosphatase [Agromyces italicus]|uniref:Ppx/GppA phosphatase family protein n=1 Tax=Agromyces italicus TaxID=279572 RepID=UPI0003B34049|nr:phosphatase [Agromyces italicus]
MHAPCSRARSPTSRVSPRLITSSVRRRRSGRSRASPAGRRTASAPTIAASCGARASTTGFPGSRIPADARPALPGISADRTFQIVAGAVVLSEAMRAFGVSELDVSPWALREGLILRRLDLME